jgi:hypothetical protein
MPEENEMSLTDTTGLEEALRVMLAAEARQLQERDHRRLAQRRAARPGVPRRARRVVASAGAAAVAAGILVGAQALGVTEGMGRLQLGPATADAAPEPALSIVFGSRTTTLPNLAATVTVPVPRVSGVHPEAARRVSGAIGDHLAEARRAFRSRITDPAVVAVRPAATDLTQEVTATTVTWKQFVTARFDDTETGALVTAVGSGARTLSKHSALVFDAETGVRVLPPDLFTDLGSVEAAVRSELASQNAGHVKAGQLASLSLKPSAAGTTTPLTCYPAPDGLRCAVDDGVLTPGYAGPLEGTVPWQQLSALLQPRLRD